MDNGCGAMRVARESSQEATEESKLGMMVAKAREWQWCKKRLEGLRIRDEVEYLCMCDLEIEHVGAVSECGGVYLRDEGERVKDDSQISSLNGWIKGRWVPFAEVRNSGERLSFIWMVSPENTLKHYHYWPKKTQMPQIPKV